jgi:hypothetical protein
MNCFECAKANGTKAHEFTDGGTHYACAHEIPHTKPLRGVPAGIKAAARHHTATVA